MIVEKHSSKCFSYHLFAFGAVDGVGEIATHTSWFLFNSIHHVDIGVGIYFAASVLGQLHTQDYRTIF